ncbi:DUF3604 domain-containing protein [Microbulbifer pacificus]|uniref:DUF3604 domain-containing protein n=1 Tax=Microbulbifer pacificus TaxID=407164 RepID=UPI000CF5162D|nr:DUF3604 domain-containing protein [Microbulbifer pacificus]
MKRNQTKLSAKLLALLLAAQCSAPLFAGDISTPYSPQAGRNIPDQLLWGDTHLHTRLSLDARAFGATLDPETAYRLARGEVVTASRGEKVKLSRPLNWLVIADHSDALGVMDEIITGNPHLLSDPKVRDWHQRINSGGKEGFGATMELILAVGKGDVPAVMSDGKISTQVWQDYVATADKFNVPGYFSAIIGYEWTSMPGGNNLHRNVLYRDGAEQAVRVQPFTAMESDRPEDLWAWMNQYEQSTGGRVLALAHNGNLSNGWMFPEINPATGTRIDREYALTRARWEPIYEVTQMKGDGEAHPYLSTSDEFADYETWDKSNLGPVPKKPEMLQYEYAREALKNGLKLEAELGVNPYKFGMVGSTDSHTGLSTAEENNFFGKHSGVEPDAERTRKPVGKLGDITLMGWEMVGSGYAAVWATENTREAIFDAMMRKEVYATTGPRMELRFFGGWNFEAADATSSELAAIGYSKGVPMGGDLARAPEGRAPRFLLSARRDPMSGNLDRVQIVKGWLNENGETRENVYDVVWSGDREMGRDGVLPAVGNTVNVADASWSNRIGAPELSTVWEDPDFDPAQRAFYYARVIEIPTPRWTAYDAAHFERTQESNVPMVTQERAYSSPIWYTP